MALDSVEKKKLCPIDGKFLSRSGMNNHIKSCHENQNWTCDMCPKIFKTKLEKQTIVLKVFICKKHSLVTSVIKHLKLIQM